MEYFEEALDILLSHESIKSDNGIGVIGISRSAEIALLMGTYLSHKVLFKDFFSDWDIFFLACSK